MASNKNNNEKPIQRRKEVGEERSFPNNKTVTPNKMIKTVKKKPLKK